MFRGKFDEDGRAEGLGPSVDCRCRREDGRVWLDVRAEGPVACLLRLVLSDGVAPLHKGARFTAFVGTAPQRAVIDITDLAPGNANLRFIDMVFLNEPDGGELEDVASSLLLDLTTWPKSLRGWRSWTTSLPEESDVYSHLCSLIPPEDRTDALLSQVADEASLERMHDIVGMYQERFMLRAQKLLRDPHDAGDVTQEAFLRLWLTVGDFNPHHERAFAFVWRAFAFAVADFRRRRHRRILAMAKLEVDPAVREAPEEEVERQSVKDAVVDAIRRLEAECKQTMELRYICGLSCKEIADALELPLGTVFQHCNKGRKLLGGDHQLQSLMKDE